MIDIFVKQRISGSTIIYLIMLSIKSAFPMFLRKRGPWRFDASFANGMKASWSTLVYASTLKAIMLLVVNLAITKWYNAPEKWLKPWHMGTNMRVLSKSCQMNTNMTGFRWFLTLMLLVANLANTKWYKKPWKMTEDLAHGYSSESTQQELSN